MTFAARNDEITLALGSLPVRVRCRASLRAATQFMRNDGFADLPRRIADFHLATIRDLVTTTATDRQEAAAFLDRIDTTPLQTVRDTITAPILTLVAGFIPEPDADTKPDPTGRPMPWPKVYRELFRTATGWLNWPPETAWNATPTEINEAFAGHAAKLKAIHGSAEDEKPAHDPREEVSEEEVRAGLAKLRMEAKRGRQHR